jgi:hypothetical protein
MEQILYLEVDDDILTVRERLRRAQARHVLLVVPPGCQALQRDLDFRLLHRQVAALDLNVALVSDDPKLRDMALSEGLAVFSRLSLGKKVSRKGQEWRTHDQPGLEGLAAREERKKPKWWRWILGPLAVAAVAFALIWSAIMIWPSATVSVVPAREPIGVSVWVEADPSTRMVDWERLRMPARVVQIEVVDRGEVETTGITNVADEQAGGTVLFVNATQREVAIPPDTIVSTSAGTPVRFRTVQQAAVPPRGRARVSVQALEPGPGGNVRANLINRIEGGLAASLRVTNEQGTGGGTTEQVRRVTHGDKQRVSDLLVTKLIQKGHAELSGLLEEEFLPIESMWINGYSIRSNYDHHVDDQSDTLALEMRAVVGGLAVSEESAEEMTRRALARQVRSGFSLLPETVQITRAELVDVDEETGVVRFVVDGVALMEADIDETLLLRAIRGKPVDEAMAYMRQALPAEVDPALSVHPGWMTRVPWLTIRIGVVDREPEQRVGHALPGS